jgi:hypothetical protein
MVRKNSFKIWLLETYALVNFIMKFFYLNTGSHRSKNIKHVVLCSATLQYDLIIDFLNEFYGLWFLKKNFLFIFYKILYIF